MVFVSCIEVVPCCYKPLKLLKIAISCSVMECHVQGDVTKWHGLCQVASKLHGQR